MSGDRQAEPGPASVVVPGNHDGVHLGHQALLRSAREVAAPQGLLVAALTFSPHPAALLAPERAPTPLTTIERRTELLRAAGADRVVVQPFDREFASQPPLEFLERLVRTGVRGLVVGPDFRFGRDRAGDLGLLRSFANERGLSVKIEPPVMQDGIRVSSSAIREAIAEGEVSRATSLLGHAFDIDGTVVMGDQRGRTLGFPTANLECDRVLQPGDGVYAAIVRILGDEAPAALVMGVLNIGTRPTFDRGRTLEVHLLDFGRDLYGHRLRVGFVERLRGVQRFDGVDALRRQIEVDCQSARARLKAADAGTWAWI